jgi:hypothetical protein
MARNNASYFLHRAAEEQAAAERSSCAAAARVHRELSLRYALKLILPEPQDQVRVGPPPTAEGFQPVRPTEALESDVWNN